IPLLRRENATFTVSTMEIDRYTDQEIAQAILRRDILITKEYLYRKCYPLFKAIYDKHYTDCENPIELINEIYVYILMPHRETHRSKLQDFGFRCTLTMWLKIVTENYCHQLFAKRIQSDENNDVSDDRNDISDDSFIANTRKLDMDDVQKILSMMPNQRYRKLIEYRYIDEKSNEETALLLEMSMANYYNCHKRAKAQYCEALRKEGLI
ncbi:MAG: sigma-70 family RNA polymerase sigma factor, partial [Prevotella sp.]|nr:sigma-70 family RNA polymerase sigma factor [Prevotella sp.]